MDGSYEQILLAIAVRNGFLTQEQALNGIHGYRQLRERPSIEDYLSQRRLLTVEQLQTLSAATQKVMSPAPSSTTDEDPIPGYRIAKKIGVGGVSVVFQAEDLKHRGRAVALKIMQSGKARDPKMRLNFLCESRLLCEFAHPNLVRGYEYAERGPLVYLALEFIDGESIQQALDRGEPLEEARALEITLEIAKALEYIQSKGFLHRDVKPGNIMVRKNNSVVLCDLGFAQPITPVEGSEGVEETTSGTVQYMSPEQARGQRDLDVRADIYSLGATLYHMVMGAVPFSGGDSVEIMAKQVLEALNSSEIKNRRISKHMHYFIERMMSKDKNLRYATPAELIADIHAQIDGFRSLEFDPTKVQHDSAVLSGLRGGEPRKDRPTTRRVNPVSPRLQKPGDTTRRFKKL